MPVIKKHMEWTAKRIGLRFPPGDACGRVVAEFFASFFREFATRFDYERFMRKVEDWQQKRGRHNPRRCNPDRADEAAQYFELVVDGHHGVYAPQFFVEMYEDDLTGVDREDVKTVLAGPDEEWYWEAWDNIERDGLVKVGRKEYTIYQHEGDIFLVDYDAPDWAFEEWA